MQLDYSALGAEPVEVSPEQIVQQWRSVLPGFERTIHHPHDLAVWVVSDRATATCDALALHLIDGEAWTVSAGYDIELTRSDDRWLIRRIRLSLYDEHGDRSLNLAAIERVQRGPALASVNTDPTHVDRVEAFFAALEAGEPDRFAALFAEEAVQVSPFARDEAARQKTGRAAIRKKNAAIGDFTSLRFLRTIHPTSDPTTVLAAYDAEIVIEPGKTYRNRYLGLWRFDQDGRITRFTKFFRPAVQAGRWPGSPPPHYSVHGAGASPESGVALREVTFASDGDELVGHLFLPPGFDDTRKYPAVVVTGSWTSVKEQMPDAYASQLAAAGFVALTFDFRGFGESEGQPRQFEDSGRKIEDIRAAVGFLSKHDNVSDQIAGLGVCASGIISTFSMKTDRAWSKPPISPTYSARMRSLSAY